MATSSAPSSTSVEDPGSDTASGGPSVGAASWWRVFGDIDSSECKPEVASRGSPTFTPPTNLGTISDTVLTSVVFRELAAPVASTSATCGSLVSHTHWDASITN